jgi:tripartite-type tricarboxylate transporter receptor subunit TctC
MLRSIFGLLVLGLGLAPTQAAEPVSFAGKTITNIVVSAPGGGTDGAARVIAAFLTKHLPGNPAVVVKNVPGAQGITAMNYFVKQVAPDGLTIITASNTQGDPLLFRAPQSQFDPTKLAVVGGAGRGGSVLIISKDAEARLRDKSKPPAIMGSLAGVPRSGHQMAAWGIAFLDWNAKWVVGYPGTSQLAIALERGEIDMNSTSNLFVTQQLLDTGKFNILVQTGDVKNGVVVGRAEFGNAPIITNLMEGKLKTLVEKQAFNYWAAITALDKWVALPPGTPQPIVDSYRETYRKAFTDPEFAAMGKKISEDFQPMAWDDITQLLKNLGDTSPEALAFTNEMLQKQGIQRE